MALFFDISVSLDGYVAGPDPSLEDPLGKGGERLHEWVFGAQAWREAHDLEGGETGADSDFVQATIDRTGAHIMGRNMFSGGFTDSWDDDPRSSGWWGDEPPFHKPVFVLTHHAREPLALGETTFTFVTDGPERALELAREAAGDRDVQISGGAEAIRQYVRLGLVDEMQIHVAPVLLGGGVRLFDGEVAPVEGTTTHLVYRSISSSPA
jgi:dihydrofolate reductase